MNTKALINTSYVHGIHIYMCLMLLFLIRGIWVILCWVSQFDRFGGALKVSLIFTCGLQVVETLLLKELNMSFVISWAQWIKEIWQKCAWKVSL